MLLASGIVSSFDEVVVRCYRGDFRERVAGREEGLEVGLAAAGVGMRHGWEFGEGFAGSGGDHDQSLSNLG